jgi:hypothetical protein
MNYLHHRKCKASPWPERRNNYDPFAVARTKCLILFAVQFTSEVEAVVGR